MSDAILLDDILPIAAAVSAICACGRRAPIDAHDIAGRTPGITIGEAGRALKCRECGWNGGTMLCFTLIDEPPPKGPPTFAPAYESAPNSWQVGLAIGFVGHALKDEAAGLPLHHQTVMSAWRFLTHPDAPMTDEAWRARLELEDLLDRHRIVPLLRWAQRHPLLASMRMRRAG